MYEQLFIFPLVKHKIIVFAANNSRCCECHVAPTIILCFGLVAPTIMLSALAPPPPPPHHVVTRGGSDTLAVEGVGGANADEGTDTIVLCILAHRTSPLNN